MKPIFFIFIIAFLSISGKAQQQASNNNQKRSLDSAIYYFNASKTASGIDSLVFEKGLRKLNRISVDDTSIQQIEKVMADFKGIKKSYFYNAIQISILAAFENAHEYHKEIEYGKAIINQYDATPNPDDRALFIKFLNYLRIPFRVSDNLNAGFDFYTIKLKLYLERNDSAAISTCYYVHGGFYHTKGLNESSIYYYKKSIAYLNINDTINKESGREQLENNTAVLGNLYNTIGDYHNAILYSLSSLKFKKEDNTHVAYVYKNIAYSKIMLNELDSVIDIINSAINISKSANEPISLANSYMVKGIYYQKTNEADSSEFYFQLCNKLIVEFDISANSVEGNLIPHYYLALLRVKQNRFKDAADLLKTEIPRLINLREELMKEYKLLVEVNLNLGDLKNANAYFALYANIQEQLKEDEQSTRKMSFETEQKIGDAESTITNLISEKKLAALSRNYLVGIAILLFIIVMVINNRFRITRSQKKIIEKEKLRSEELLLNILPAEVAEELKETGTAAAKHFDNVTVLFTDFVNFTQVSETLSPQELVNELHTCFKAFDDIIGKYGIEKIKTIGDAYLAVCGLPLVDERHPQKAVQAALDIINFMQTRRQQMGAKTFEIRIGINTGSVVAGIVGVRKFAYDIWGDTVNTAARMEQHSEPGKINISETTYSLVKDKFNCIHRGKISAKGKGEIDMYFVESSK